MGDPDSTEFIEKETMRIPYATGVSPPDHWRTTFKTWPFPAIGGWRDWYRRIADKKSQNWDALDINHCLELSLSRMPKNEPLLMAVSHFWSDAVNAFIFGHGPMTITLADIFMMTGLGVSDIPYPDRYKGKSNQKAIKPGGGWISHIQTYMEEGPVSFGYFLSYDASNHSSDA